MNDPHKSDQIGSNNIQLSDGPKSRDINNTKSDSSPSNLLSNVKSLNIDKTKYHHYGYQSSMNAQALETIMNQDQRVPSRSTLSSPIQEKDESDGIKKSKLIIDKNMGQILGIPVGDDSETVWPYTSETLSELLKFKTEQERTKQEQMRNEYASTALQLFTLIKSMNINQDIIPQIFQHSITDLKSRLESLKANPGDSLAFSGDDSKSSESNRKRSYSDTLNTSSIKVDMPRFSNSVLVSPLRSPVVKLPVSLHRRERSDESDPNINSSIHSPSSAHNTSYPEVNVSQQHSPNHVAQGPPPHMYPVYYSHIPPGPPPSQASGENTKPGSPYQQKYHPMMFPPPPNPSLQPPYSGPYYPQQYHYYIASPPAPNSTPGSQLKSLQNYPGIPIPPVMLPQQAYPAPDADDSSPSHKKQKSLASNKNINFMISTPKNPPARKYNHPKEK